MISYSRFPASGWWLFKSRFECLLELSVQPSSSGLLRWFHTAGSISVVSLCCEPIPVCAWTKDPWKQQDLTYWTFFSFFGKHYLLVLLLLLISCLLANLPLYKSCMLSISFPSSFCIPIPQQRYCKSPFPPSYLHSPIKHLDVKISQLLAGCLPKTSLRFWLTRKSSKFFLTDHVGSVKVWA